MLLGLFVFFQVTKFHFAQVTLHIGSYSPTSSFWLCVCVCVSGVVLIEMPRCSLGLNVSGSGFSQFGMGDRDLQWISNYLNLLGAAWERAAPRCHQPVTEKAGLV